MKTKPKFKRATGSRRRRVLALGREIFEAALYYRRQVEGFNDGYGWKGMARGQYFGWEGVGDYISKNFTRRKKKRRHQNNEGQP